MEEFKHAGYTIKIEQEQDPQNPRSEFDNFGVMVCFHRRYNLGDCGGQRRNVNEGVPQFADPDDFRRWWKDHKDAVVLPLYLYDHSGLTMNTTGFSCPWDSGQVGWIYASAERIRSEYSVKRITKKVRDKVKGVLVAEVAVYDMYLRGDVYGYTVEDEDGNHIDSCWGFYGYGKGEHSSWDYMIQQAKNAAEYAAKNACVAAAI